MELKYIIYGVWALVAMAFAYQVIKKRGLKGAIFGAAIARTVGELELGKNGPMRTILKFHCLESTMAGAPTIGIEVINRSIASYHMFPIRLTSEQVGVVKELLTRAVAESQGSFREQAASLVSRS